MICVCPVICVFISVSVANVYNFYINDNYLLSSAVDYMSLI